MVLDKTVKGSNRLKWFYKNAPLAFIMDQVPDANELKVNTKVVALFDKSPRYFSGKILHYNTLSGEYYIDFDDDDFVYATPSSIRLLKRPPPYC